ncbi:MAG: hypothetical protein M1608_06415, partial [Candidatus Omnitrophica bacterium]|nr:hypothetical protein [Candidatus Omnitrophota bacterium]
MEATQPNTGRYAGSTVDLVPFGPIRLTRVLTQNAETEVYFTDRPGIVVKVFDLSCWKADEVSYGPYMSFCLE